MVIPLASLATSCSQLPSSRGVKTVNYLPLIRACKRALKIPREEEAEEEEEKTHKELFRFGFHVQGRSAPRTAQTCFM